ncbi:MAG: carboxypeptidase-like regulatory domain-containing protein [Marinifilaceae bacterium]
MGQQITVPDSVSLIGVIFDKETLSPLSQVSCYYGEQVVASDNKGRFYLRVHKHDTISFTHIGYSKSQYIIPDSLRNNEYTIGIFLSQDTILLAEVVVMERYLPKNSELLQNARNNMRGVTYSAFFPKEMDANMNQRMGIEQFATSIEMKGHVKVGLSVGTHSVAAYQLLRLKNKLEGEQFKLSEMEIDVLKRLYNKEK